VHICAGWSGSTLEAYGIQTISWSKDINQSMHHSYIRLDTDTGLAVNDNMKNSSLKFSCKIFFSISMEFIQTLQLYLNFQGQFCHRLLSPQFWKHNTYTILFSIPTKTIKFLKIRYFVFKINYVSAPVVKTSHLCVISTNYSVQMGQNIRHVS
jgi:hypothetical protein